MITNKCKWRIFLTASLAFGFLSYAPPHFAAAKPYGYYKGVHKNICGNALCDPFRFFITLSGGAAWANVGGSQSFVDDGSLYNYIAFRGVQREALWGASLGEELRFSPDWSMQVGLSYYQTSAFEGTGTVTQGVDPASSVTFPYSFQLIARQYLVESKILLDVGQGWHPYLSAGLGASFNTTSDYTVTGTDLMTFSPLYKGESNTALSGNVGIGIDYDLMQYVRVGIAYRYDWYGAANLGDGRINTTEIANTIKQNLITQEGMLQLTFLI